MHNNHSQRKLAPIDGDALRTIIGGRIALLDVPDAATENAAVSLYPHKWGDGCLAHNSKDGWITICI